MLLDNTIFNTRMINKRNRGEYSEFVRIPKYLNKDGLFPAVFTTIAFSQKWIKQGVVKLPKQFSFTTRTNKQNIQQLRFIPKNGYIVLEVPGFGGTRYGFPYKYVLLYAFGVK